VRARHCISLVCLTLLVLTGVRAQSPNGTISGLVVDSSGAVIVGSDILLENYATNVQYAAKTNKDGIYLISNLPPGTYRLQVSKFGFRTLIKPDIVLALQDSLAINFTLSVGAASEVVTVTAGAPMVDTTDGSVSTVVDQNYIGNMPLNGRSFQDLILLTPGSVTQSPQNGPNSQLGQTGEFSINGQRPEANYYAVDGVSANMGAAPGVMMLEWAGASGSVPSSTALGTTQSLVSVDDLKEFRVQSSSYSAEYGRTPGGQFSFETKSGTNEWHGTAYDYLRNGYFDANDWFNDYLRAAQPAVHQNDFGGTLGGPVRIPGIYNGKDKTFFFVSYEGLRLRQPQEASINYVPDATLRAAVPAPLSQVLAAFPLANGPEAGNGMAEFLSTWSNPSSLDSTSVRLDQMVGSRSRLFFRFSDTPSERNARGTGSFATPSMVARSSYVPRTYTGGADTALTSRMSNDFRANYSSNRVTSDTMIDGFGGGTPGDLAALTGLPPAAAPSVVILYGGYQLALGQPKESATQRQINLVDSVAFAWNRQQIEFGADYRRLTPVAAPFNPFVEYLFLSEASLESNSALAVADSSAEAYPLYQNLSLFAQDDWRIASRLSLSFGLRWELNPAPGVTQGLKPYTVEGSSPSNWTLAPEGTELWDTTWYNFAPRLGFAYVVRRTPNYETVLRGGVGVFYDTGQQMGSFGFEGPGFTAMSFYPAASFPLTPAQAAPAITNPPVAPYNAPVIGFARHLQLPYTIQWNATIEQSLGASQAVSASYVGAHGARLLEQSEISGSAAGNPNASAFFIFQNGLTSDYNALELQFRRRLAEGLTALASYTWSHCIDYDSQNYLFPYQRGDCDYDVTHNVSAAFSYDLPNEGRHGISKTLLDGWGVDDRFTARTGFPVTLTGDAVPDAATGRYYYQGLDLVPGQPVYLRGAACAAAYNNGLPCPGGWAVNPLAFSAPASGLGNAPRNFVRGFGAWQMDLAVRRDFSLYERLKLQFRAEAFNIFNHPDFGYINPNFGENTFGQATGTLASTLGILSPLYQMGGPRSMQFALKFIF
jgi:hypothetical protein